MLHTFQHGFSISIETSINTLESCLAIIQNFSMMNNEYKRIIVKEGFLGGISKSILESEIEVPDGENPENKKKVEDMWKEL